MKYKSVFKALVCVVMLLFSEYHLQTREPLWHWAVSAGGTRTDLSSRMVIDHHGHIHLTGYFTGSINFGDLEFESRGITDLYKVQLSPEGEWMQVITAGGSERSRVSGTGIALDLGGNCYLTGSFGDSLFFADITLTGSLGTNTFVSKLSPEGDLLWAAAALSGERYAVSSGISTDSAGNVYITGSFNEMASFGDIDLECSGINNIFVAKLNNQGEWQWAVRAGGNREIFSNDIVTDQEGNSYITGHFSSTADFGELSLESAGEYDLFIAKINTDGEWLGLYRAGGEESAVGRAITIDDAGNCYVTGYFYGNAEFGDDVIRSSGSYDILTAKLSNEGEWLWAARAGGIHGCSGRDIAVDDGGNVFISGYIQGRATFGIPVLQSRGSYDAFIAKLNNDGGWLWSKNGGGVGTDSSYGIAIDNERNRYICGFLSQTARFGETILESEGDLDIFVAKIGEYSPFPATSHTPYPADGSVGVAVNTDSLRWSYDADDYYTEPAGFKVFFGISEDFDDEDYLWVSYVPERLRFAVALPPEDGLAYGTSYYWKVVPTTAERQTAAISPESLDSRLDYPFNHLAGDAQGSPVWSFQTVYGHPQNAIAPYPADNSENIPVSLDALRWIYRQDYRFLDPVGFRVYIGVDNSFENDSLFLWVDYSEEQENYSCLLPSGRELDYMTEYFWQVVPASNYPHHYNRFVPSGDAIDCPVWSFFTEPLSFTELPAANTTYLGKNYPNPFNPGTYIEFSIGQEANVSLQIHNSRGQLIKILCDEVMTAGVYKLFWDGSDSTDRQVSSGVYIVVMKGDDFSQAEKILLVK